ncbi:MAG: Glutathione S-transferase GstA [SAR92 bacterium MED-G29]|jgi:glutathione S-transferase|nr:glutathione S-transferase family protein [Porticoccaceae bacterium]MDB9843217.1 glutathione S-transferase family protein [Porticoccaceae bacterium]CAI8283213.1 MAG: Glutathione S-transferase GstA [SAR92 bacterium MED-G29]|tara:strand:- start:309 stop:968 length:660 start_codon:yes stop_codon:yes gene_type:complete
MALKLWHCAGSRSIRPLWTLEEMGLDFELEVMKFPPRFVHPGYTDINPIGTVPFFTDDAGGPDNVIQMTESAGISQYVVDRYGPTDLAVGVDEPDYGSYLNWLHRSDATLTFPQTLVLRYTILEPEATRLPKVADDYSKWFHSRLRSVEAAMADREFLCADRFTIADVAVGFALYFAEFLKLSDGFKPNTRAYYERLKARPGFQRATQYDSPSALPKVD